ncbi:unnamed protein product, partial [Mesorhabditis spiculigera]
MKILILAALICVVVADRPYWFHEAGKNAEDCKDYETLQDGSMCDAETCEGPKPCVLVFVAGVCVCKEGSGMKGPIAILGARSQLGQHVVSVFEGLHPEIALNTWAHSDELGDADSEERLAVCISDAELNPKRPISSYQLPFLPLYYIYLAIGWLLLAVNKVFDVSGMLSKMPDPSLLYLIFHHWTFFNTNKSTNLLPDHEELSREYVVKRSRDHYALMNPNRLRTSWQLHVE